MYVCVYGADDWAHVQRACPRFHVLLLRADSVHGATMVEEIHHHGPDHPVSVELCFGPALLLHSHQGGLRGRRARL